MNNNDRELLNLIIELLDKKILAEDFCKKFLIFRRKTISKAYSLSNSYNELLEKVFWPVEDFEPSDEIRKGSQFYIDEGEFIKRVKEALNEMREGPDANHNS